MKAILDGIQVRHSISIAFLSCFVMVSGCENNAAKKHNENSLAEQLIPISGHIHPKPNVDQVVGSPTQIPKISTYSEMSLPPINFDSSEIYSITAVNVPVTDLLFKIAQDANKEIDIYSGVDGLVTINAINQPLDEILTRISNQLNFVYELTKSTIVIRPDTPEWRSYEVDYVNINKISEEKIDMKMSVASGAGNSSSTGSIGSYSKVTVNSEHNFWQRLAENITRLAQLDPFTSSSEVAQNVTNQSGQNVVVNPETGSISVYATKKNHVAIKEYIEKLTERAQRQVMIEATVVEVLLNDQYQAGIDWSYANSAFFGKNGGLSLEFPNANQGTDGGFSVSTLNTSGLPGAFQTGAASIIANLDFLQQFGDSKVLSSPKIMAINNQTALLKVVENLVYFTVDVTTTDATTSAAARTTYETEVNTVPVGFTMSVTPFVSDDGEVTLNIRPTISRLVDKVNDPNPELAAAGIDSFIPVIQEKEMSSVLKLKDRQTAIIGGLIEDTNSNSKSGMPWVSDVPLLGDFFSKRDNTTNKSELVIFIRPVVVKNPDIDSGDLKNIAQFLKTQKPIVQPTLESSVTSEE